MTASPAHSTAKVIACSLLVSLLGAVTAYYRAFVSLAPYDDEGTMMWSLKGFFEGRPLYDHVATIYGPLYYFYQWCAHVLTGTPLSHHSVRMVSIAFWVATALIVFLLAYRTTGSLLLACLTHNLAFRAMVFIGDEPAHPQEACAFLLVTLGLACFARNRTWRAAIMGALAGLLVATKVNLGIFVVVAISAGFAYSWRPKWLRTTASILASAGMLVFPVLLMWGHLPEWWAVKFCALVVVSLASAIVIVAGADEDVPVGFRDLIIAGVSLAGAIAALCWFVLAHGSTMRAMIDWVIIRPGTSFGHGWYLPAPIRSFALAWAAIGFILAYCVRSGRVSEASLAFVKVGFAVAVIALCVAGRFEALFNFVPQQALLNFAPPLLWLVAAPSGKAGSATQDSQARTLLLLLGVIQVLYAYPIAGSQTGFTTVLMIVIAGICLSDGFAWICGSLPAGRLSQLFRARPARLAAALCLGAIYLSLAWKAASLYASFEPLGFPGTGSMRVEPQKAANLRALVAKVNASGCRTLITEPGLFSFNLFTGKPAPAGLNSGAWIVALSAAEQESIVREVAQDPDACVIRRQDMVDQWTRRGDTSSQPLVRYIRENFRSAFEVTDYSFLVRKH
jgi:hypothetical protein